MYVMADIPMSEVGGLRFHSWQTKFTPAYQFYEHESSHLPVLVFVYFFLSHCAEQVLSV
jgi:hypothetical protein